MGIYKKHSLHTSVLVKFRRIRHDAFSFSSQYPRVFIPLTRLMPRQSKMRGKVDQVMGKRAELLIDGFPRSGNTFAVCAFKFSQPYPVVVANHTHAAAQVVCAAQRGIPSLVLIRNPEDAVLSLVIRVPERSIKVALRDYIRFYKTIKLYRDSYVIAEFEEVISDFGEIIKRLNRRFGTDFAPFVHTDENVHKVFELIEQGDREEFALNRVTETRVGRPSSERDRIKALLKNQLEAESLKDLIATAKSMYADFTGHSS
jgi:hypothetical protein